MTLMERDERPEMPTPEMPEKFRITAALYHQMFELGAFEGKRVELLEGEIYEMSAMPDPHAAALTFFGRELNQKLLEHAWIIQETPITLDEQQDGEPEPDFALLKAEKVRRGKQHARDLSLVVEISDSSLKRDRTMKVRLYARANIPEYWIINLNTDPNTLEVYREPDGDEYLERKVYKVGQDVAPLEFPEILIRWW